MKRHEAIKRAYELYPKGVKFEQISSKAIIESTGVFFIGEYGNNWAVCERTTGNFVYNQKIDKWAEIITSEPLKVEKVAVRINNQRELDLYNKFKDTNWNVSNYGFPVFMYQAEGRGFDCTVGDVESCGFNIIDFDFFCAQKGIPYNKFVMTSEDGVDLHEKDNCYVVVNRSNKWVLDYHSVGTDGDEFIFRATDNGKFFNDGYQKVFANKCAAETWIDEQDKPILTTEDGVDLYEGDKYFGITNIGKGWSHIDTYQYSVTPDAVKYLNKMTHEAKAFSTKQAAQKWIERHSRSFITNDFVKVSYDEEYYAVEKDHKITRYVLCTTPNGIAQFSTRMLAEQWIEEQNKPVYFRVDLAYDKYAEISKEGIGIYSKNFVPETIINTDQINLIIKALEELKQRNCYT